MDLVLPSDTLGVIHEAGGKSIRGNNAFDCYAIDGSAIVQTPRYEMGYNSKWGMGELFLCTCIIIDLFLTCYRY